MITKRKGNGQTECRGCKEKSKFALTWDSFLYNFNDKPYCFNCLMEKLEELQQKIDKAIEYIENYGHGYDISGDVYYSLDDDELNELMEILKGV